VGCLDIVWMVVSPGSAHSFRISMVRNDVVVVGELFVADGAYSGLLPHLAVQQFSHLRRRSQFPVSSRVVRIFHSLDSETYQLRLGEYFASTARRRPVDRAHFVGTESHGRISPCWVGRFRGLGSAKVGSYECGRTPISSAFCT